MLERQDNFESTKPYSTTYTNVSVPKNLFQACCDRHYTKTALHICSQTSISGDENERTYRWCEIYDLRQSAPGVLINKRC